MEEATKTRLRIYAWNYFSFHAEQRIKTFNLYLILVTAIVAGIITIYTKNAESSSSYVASLLFLLTFVSLMFALLDVRNRELVKNGEVALRSLDELERHERKGGRPNVLEIFAADDHPTANKPAFPFLKIHITYTKVFSCIFIVFGSLGFIIGCKLLFL